MSWMEPDPPKSDLTRLGPHVRSLTVAIAVGVAAGVVGLLISAALLLYIDEATYTPLVAAVAIAVWYAGGFAGAGAVVVGWSLGAVFLAYPRGQVSFADRDEFIRWAASLGVGIFVAAVGFVMRRGQERAAGAAIEAEHSRGRVQRLQNLAAALSAALTPEDVARVLVESVPPAIGARGGALGLLDGDDLVVIDPAGATGQTLAPGSRLPLATRAPIAAAARLGDAVWVERRQDFVERFPDGAALAPYAASALAVPVFRGSRVVGAMGFPFAAPGAVDEEVRAIAAIAADLGGQALERADLYAQEHATREGLDRILAVAPRFQRGATPEEVTRSICAEARRTFVCDAAQVWTPVEGGQLAVTWRDPPSEVLPSGIRISFDDFPGLLDEMTALRAMFVADAQAAVGGRALNHARELGIHSSLRLPIVIGGRFERILTLQWNRVIGDPSPALLALARRFADQAGLAIEQAERRRAQDETRLLQSVTEALAAAATPAEVGEAIVRQGVAAFGGRGATVYATRPDGDGVELVAAEGYPPAMLEGWRTIPLDAVSPVTDAIRVREVITCETYGEILARYPFFERTEESLVAAPLVVADRVIGAVFIGSGHERHYGPAELGLVLGMARQAAQALDRAQLFEREQASAARMRTLQEVTAGLSKALTIADVSRTCLDRGAAAIGAAAGVVALRRPGSDELEIVHFLGYDRADLEPWLRIPLSAHVPIAEAARTGNAIWALGEAERDAYPAVREISERSGDRGWIALPLGDSGAVTGALLFTFRDDRTLTREERDWIVTLASQCTQALDRARRYEAERETAETLQRSVLPDRLPAVDGVAIAARYLPGTAGVEVGGDWYDAMEVGEHLVGFVVGDVVGKGVRAAATMGQLRNALRAFAFEHPDPADAVAHLSRYVESLADAPFATLAYVVVDPRRHRARYVVAGHPPPVVRSPDGTAAFLEAGRALPLGVDAEVAFTAGEVVLGPGSTVVLYTDGLVERRDRALDDGLEQLRQAVEACDGDIEELVDAVLSGLFANEERDDDIAIVALQLERVAVEGLHLTLPLEPGGLVEMRESLRGWLSRARVPSEEGEEIVLAAWEAGANAIEHAQAPSEASFSVDGTVRASGWVRLEVRDTGGWKPAHVTDDRGLGLTLMRSLMDSVDVRPSETGTIVALERYVGSISEV